MKSYLLLLIKIKLKYLSLTMIWMFLIACGGNLSKPYCGGHPRWYTKDYLAWGGDWGGAQGVDETKLPVTYEIDYVRVYQK